MELAATARCVWDAKALLGEGAVWDAASRRLYWVDIKGGEILALEPASGRRRRWSVPPPVGCVVPAGPDRLLAALGAGITLLDVSGDRPQGRLVVHPEAERLGNRYNDGACDPQGRFWVGSMDDAEMRPSGAFWRLDADGAVACVDDGYVIANGPAFSPDGGTVYLTDSGRRTVWRAGVTPDGRLSGKTVFARFDQDGEAPDGMAVDRDGGVWIAVWGGGCVRRFSPDGRWTHSVSVPASQVTRCAFGGPDLDILFIATARIGLDDQALSGQPLAGGLFACRPGPVGMAVAPWAGGDRPIRSGTLPSSDA